jgi:hypothetical protein
MKHQASKSHEMQASDGGWQPLIVACQAAEASHPGEGALDNPVTLPPKVVFCL